MYNKITCSTYIIIGGPEGVTQSSLITVDVQLTLRIENSQFSSEGKLMEELKEIRVRPLISKGSSAMRFAHLQTKYSKSLS